MTSEKKEPGFGKQAPCLSATTQSGIKYAIAWIAYVLIGSWVFLVLEKSSTAVIVENAKWIRLKQLITMGAVVDELHELRIHLQQLCPHHSFNSSFDELLSDSGYFVERKNESFPNDDPINTLIPSAATRWIEEAEAACSASLTILEEVAGESEWTMVDAIYYTMTLVTTIGFGHISPKQDVGKMFCVVYGLVGVPLTCILMAKNSDMLSNRLLHLYETTKKRYSGHPRTLLYGVTWMFLILGCFVFMFLPSIAFAALEGWTYVDSFYFTFITLSTIGFGDYIAGYGDAKPYSDVYKIAVVVWIMIALGYWILLLNFLQKAIKSNAKSLKKTFQSKNITKQAEFLWHLMAKAKKSQRTLLSGPKVKQQESTNDNLGITADERLHMMALMVEAMSASKTMLHRCRSGESEASSRFSRSRSSIGIDNRSGPRKVPQDGLQLMTMMVESLTSKSTRAYEHSAVMSDENPSEEPVEESTEEVSRLISTTERLSSITFDDLMKVNVALKTENLHGFEAYTAQSEIEGKKINVSSEPKNGDSDEGKQMDEITLPLRDVMGIVLFAASMDDTQERPIDETPSEDSAHTSSSGPIVDPRESVPLLRSIFSNGKDGEDQSQKDMNLQRKESVKNAYFESALSRYLEDCSQLSERGFDDCPDDDPKLRRNRNHPV